MAGFVCPNCAHHTDIFKPTTGGADTMCSQMSLRLLGKIPLEPAVLISTEKGQCILESNPESKAAQVYKGVVEEIVKKLGA